MTKKYNLDEIFQASPVPTCILEPDCPHFTISMVNQAYMEMTGKTEDELLGKSPFVLFPPNPDESEPAGTARILESFNKVIETKKADDPGPIRYDIVREGTKYTEMYWKVVNIPLLSDDNEVEFIINTFSDITDQVINERANRLMLNHTDESFIFVDRDLVIQNFNDPFSKDYKFIFGSEVKRGESILNYAQPDRLEMVKKIYEKVFTGETIESEFSVKTPDDESRYFTIRYKPARDKENLVIGSFVSVTDTTAEHQVLQQLKVNEKRYRALIENGRDVVILFSDQMKPFYVSATVKNVLGYTVEEVMDRDISDFIHEEDLEGSIESFRESLEKPGESLPGFSARMKHKDGSWRWVEATITNMLEDPDIEGVVDNFRDVTEQKNYEEEIKNSLAEKETLLAEVHHRVKNNLAVVSGMMQLQAFEADHPELRSLLFDSVVRIKTMATVHELLYQSGTFSKLDFSETLRKLTQNISNTLRSETRIELDFQCEVIRLNINQAIPASLIVNEVITNVYKHAFRGRTEGTLKCYLREEENLVRLTITDNGSGLPDNIKTAGTKGSLGFHLINLLSKQIHAIYDYKKLETGTEFNLTFRKSEYKSGIGNSRLT